MVLEFQPGKDHGPADRGRNRLRCRVHHDDPACRTTPGSGRYGAGVRLALDLPGFAFANLDTFALLDASKEAWIPGAPPSEDDIPSWSISISARPFRIGAASFSIGGHIEYRHETDNELGREGQVLGPRPTAASLESDPNDIAVGIEYQFWLNKLGEGATDESAVQALLVWKF